MAVEPAVVVVAVRSGAGRVLDKRIVDLVLPADGSTIAVRHVLGLRPEDVAAVRWLDVAVRGARTVIEPLASFALS